MAQVQFEFSKIKAPDPSGQTRARVTSLPGTHDFASMIDDSSNDDPPKAAPVDNRSARIDHYTDGSSSRRAESSAPRDRFTSDRADRPDTPSRLRDDSRPRTADGPADKAESGDASNPREAANSQNGRDQGVGKTDSDGDTEAEPAAKAETVPGLAPIVTSVVQPNSYTPDGEQADDTTIVGVAAAVTTVRSGMQSGEADASHTDAKAGQARESSHLASAAFLTALPQKKLGAETTAKDSKGDEVARAEVLETDAAPENASKAEKTDKGGKPPLEEAEGEAGAAAAQTGEKTTADEQPSPQPDRSDAAKPHDAREPSHKDAHARTDSLADKSGTK